MTPGAYAFIAFFVILLGWIAWEIYVAPVVEDEPAGVDEWEDGM